MRNKKQHGNPKRPNKKPSNTAKHLPRDLLITSSHRRFSVNSLNRPSTPRGLSESPEQLAICFFLVHIQPRMKGYWTDHLPILYASEEHGSILRKATLSVAYIYTSLHPQYARYKKLAISEYIGVIRLINELIGSATTKYDDAFVVALLLLELFEVSPPRKTIADRRELIHLPL